MTQPQQPSQRSLTHPFAVRKSLSFVALGLGCTGLAMLVWWSQRDWNDHSDLIALSTEVLTKKSSEEWDLLAWDKTLWPRQAAAVAQQAPPPPPPKATLTAIISVNNTQQAAIDFGNGLHYMRIGDQHKKMTLVRIHTSSVEMSFRDQNIRLDMP